MVIRLPFEEIPSKAITQLTDDGKKPLRPLKYGNTSNFVPFVHNTGLRCMKWGENQYLSVLDFDYDDKWDNPIYKQFEYSNTYTRESKHGLHLFYLSPCPCDIVQSKKNIKVDLRRVTTVNPNSWGNHIRLYDLPTNNLPVMEIDFNKVVESLYKQCGEPIIHYEDMHRISTRKSNYKLTDATISLYHRALAQYLRDLNSDWVHAYNLSYQYGLECGPILESDKDAEAVATALMQIVEYPNKANWIINFVNGYNDSERYHCNLGKRKLHYTTVYKVRSDLALEYVNKTDEYILNDLLQWNVIKLYQFADIINFLQ